MAFVDLPAPAISAVAVRACSSTGWARRVSGSSRAGTPRSTRSPSPQVGSRKRFWATPG